MGNGCSDERIKASCLILTGGESPLTFRLNTMNKLIITFESEEDLETTLELLTNAEEEGELTEAFNVERVEGSEQ